MAKQRMSTWTSRIGCAVFLLGAFFVSPLADILPVAQWEFLRRVFAGEPTDAPVWLTATSNGGGGHDPFTIVGAAFIGTGILMVVVGQLRKPRA